ncbi:MAG: sarcosine oxidase [Pseudomonadales bacterium]
MTNNASTSPSCKRRSPLLSNHKRLQASFTEVFGSACVAHYGQPANEVDQAKSLGLCDLTIFPRIGFKGKESTDWLQQFDLNLPSKPNQSIASGNGSFIARLSKEEYCVMSWDSSSVDSRTPVKAMEIAYGEQNPASVYDLPRSDSHCWFALTGSLAAQVLSKACAVDMREGKFSNGTVAQTSLARVNAIVIRHDQGNPERSKGMTTTFFILSDITSTEFLWTSLLDAMQEFDGREIGYNAIEALNS